MLGLTCEARRTERLCEPLRDAQRDHQGPSLSSGKVGRFCHLCAASGIPADKLPDTSDNVSEENFPRIGVAESFQPDETLGNRYKILSHVLPRLAWNWP